MRSEARRAPPDELAAAAHRAEAGRLGRQVGVQDQAAASHGGASLLVVEYPRLVAHPIAMAPADWRAVDERLVHIAYGAAHDSSALHDGVIASLERRRTVSAVASRRCGGWPPTHATALRVGDLARYGNTLTAATEAQADLHPALVSDDARALIECARTEGALGWKVNGAGGAGGSLSVLCRDPSDRERVGAGARRLGHQPLDLHLAPLGAAARISDP